MTPIDDLIERLNDWWTPRGKKHDKAGFDAGADVRAAAAALREQAQEIARWREFHRAATLAIAATFVLFKNAAERNKAALDKAEAERDDAIKRMEAGWIQVCAEPAIKHYKEAAEQAEAEADALRTDAERYRWLRAHNVEYAMHMGAVLYTPELVVPLGMDENGIDAAIDAARAREQT